MKTKCSDHAAIDQKGRTKAERRLSARVKDYEDLCAQRRSRGLSTTGFRRPGSMKKIH